MKKENAENPKRVGKTKKHYTMKNLICALVAVFAFQTVSFAQLVGDRLQIGQVYTFKSDSDPNLYISYGTQEGRASMGPARNFKVVAPLNGKEGYVSLQAVDLSGTVYLVQGDDCPYPYNGSNFFDVKSSSGDATFNTNASFAISHGKSNMGDVSLVSFVTGKGHFLKRERGVLMGQTGAGVADRYQNHFTFRFTPTTKSALATGETLKVGEKLVSANNAYMAIMQTDGNFCVYKYENGKQGGFVWCSMAHGFANGKLVMQTDGNLCVYDEKNTFKWGSYQVKKYALGGNYKLVLTDTGKLNIVNGSGDVVWTN